MLQLGTPIIGLDGQKISEIFVPNNAGIIISILSVNRDPGIWGPDVMEWKPERWLAPLPASVAEARIPGVYANTYAIYFSSPNGIMTHDSDPNSMTFLGGDHSCM